MLNLVGRCRNWKRFNVYVLSWVGISAANYSNKLTLWGTITLPQRDHTEMNLGYTYPRYEGTKWRNSISITPQ